jgi:hypothetical protein
MSDNMQEEYITQKLNCLEAKLHSSKDKSPLCPHWFGKVRRVVTLLFFLSANTNCLCLASTLIYDSCQSEHAE